MYVIIAITNVYVKQIVINIDNMRIKTLCIYIFYINTNKIK